MTAATVTLLVVNTDAAMVRQITATLRAAGLQYKVRQASSRQEFTDELKKHLPQLILSSDGKASGIAFNEILEEAQRAEAGIPVVFLGGGSRGSSAIRLLHKGAADHILPGHMDRLPLLIERVLREHQSSVQRHKLETEVERAAGLIRESQRLATLGRQASSIAHEINNPLEAISNLLFLAGNETGLPASARKFLIMAQAELERVVAISKQTLNFYREASAPLPVRLSTLVEETLVLYGRRIAEKHLKVMREFGSEDAIAILPGEMRQVFSNLLANAIEATEDGGKLRLRVRKSRCWSDSGILGIRVTIADTGSGMSPEVRRRIGHPFFTTKGQHGTGLGLWVTKSILSHYGGNLLVHTSTGTRHGTVFSVFLPTNMRPRMVGRRASTSRKSGVRVREGQSVAHQADAQAQKGA